MMIREINYYEIESVSGGNGAADIANGVAMTGAALLAIAALPVEAPTALVVAGLVTVGAAAGWAIGNGAYDGCSDGSMGGAPWCSW